MIELSEVINELSEVMDRRAAEKVAQVVFAVYERLHESLVLRRLDAIEQSVERLREELAEHRKETDARFRELAEFQKRAYEEFQEYRKQTDERFRELAEAQRRTEQRVESLTARVEELAEFQKRAYEEFQEYRKQTDERFRELAEAQRRTEQRVESLTARVEELTEAQKRTDQRIESLTARVEELTEAQKRTDQQIAELVAVQRQMQLEMQDMRRQLGGLSQTVGYVLENEAMKSLPDLLLRDYGLQVQGRLRRQYVRDASGQPIEVNIFGTATRDGEEYTVIGESKSQLSKRDVDRFLRRTIETLREVYPRVFPVLITHMISEPDAEEYARSLGVALYYSYEF
jgi:DNA repair exonuclease SbcCD ATPase subunit